MVVVLVYIMILCSHSEMSPWEFPWVVFLGSAGNFPEKAPILGCQCLAACQSICSVAVIRLRVLIVGLGPKQQKAPVCLAACQNICSVAVTIIILLVMPQGTQARYR